MWRIPKRSSIVFDLGAGGVRVCQAAAGRGAPRICDALAIEGDTQSEPDALDARLARLVDQGAFRGREVTLTLGPPHLQFHAMRVPDAALRQGDAQLSELLRWEVSSQSRAEPSDLEVRYWRLPPARKNGENVMAVSMSTQTALQWVTRLEKFGLTLRRIEAAPSALTHLAARVFPAEDDHLWAILDLGRDGATLTVVVGTTPTYVRSLTISMRRWTEQLAQALQTPVDIAERIKRASGIFPDQRRMAEGETSPAAVLFGLLREELVGLCTEIIRCLHYVRQTHDELTVTHIVLAGGGALTPGLSDFIENQIGMTTSVLNAETLAAAPGLRVPKGVSAGQVVACGSALLELGVA